MYLDCIYASGSFRLMQQPIAISSDALVPMRMRYIPIYMFTYGICTTSPSTTLPVSASAMGGVMNSSTLLFSTILQSGMPEWFQFQRKQATVIVQQDATGNSLQRRRICSSSWCSTAGPQDRGKVSLWSRLEYSP